MLAGASSRRSWLRIARSSSCRALPGSMPSSSSRARRASWYAANASACRPDRYERQHQLTTEALAARVLGDQPLEVADDLCMAPALEIGLQPLLQTLEAKLVESRDLVLREAVVRRRRRAAGRARGASAESKDIAACVELITRATGLRVPRREASRPDRRRARRAPTSST